MPKRTVLLLLAPFRFKEEAMDVVYTKLAQYQFILPLSVHCPLSLEQHQITPLLNNRKLITKGAIQSTMSFEDTELMSEQIVISPAATSSMPSLPRTPRLNPVALPEDLLEDGTYVLNAMKATDALAVGNSLGLLGIVLPDTPTPSVEEVQRLSSRL